MRGAGGGPVRGVAVLTLTGVLSQVVGWFDRVLLTRLAGAEILGLYQLILPVYSVLLSLTSVGLTTGVSNLSAWYQALGNQRVIDQVRGQAVKLFLLLALVPCGLLLLFSAGVSVYLLGDARTRPGLMLLVPCLVLTGIETLQKHYFYGTGRACPAAAASARAGTPVRKIGRHPCTSALTRLWPSSTATRRTGFPRTGWARNWSKMWSAGICASACAWPSRISIWRCGCTRCCLRG